MKLFPFLIIGLAVCIPTLHAQSGLERQGEFKVNTSTVGAQTSARIAGNKFGNFVIVWTDTGRDGGAADVYFQRYNSAGSPVGGETRANAFTAGDQYSPAVAMDDTGNFTVVWRSTGNPGGSGSDIYARRFATDGTPQPDNANNDKLVNTSTTGEQEYPQIAMAPTGEYVISWGEDTALGANGQPNGNGLIKAQRFNANGNAAGNLTSITPNEVGTGTSQSAACVSINQSLDYVIAFYEDSPRPTGQDVVVQGFHWDGSASFSRTIVNAPDYLNQTPSVALRDDGTFVVAWPSRQGPVGDDGAYEVLVRRFAANGTPLNSPVLANTTTAGKQGNVSVAPEPGGGFVVVYESANFDGSSRAVVAQRFDGNGNKDTVSREFVVNLTTVGDQVPYPGRAAYCDPDGNLVFVWQSSTTGAASDFDIYADKFYLPNQGPPLSEFRVNTTTAGDQVDAVLAMNESGQAIIAWTSVSATDPGDVYFQRYDAAGRRVGAETRANLNIGGTQTQPTVGLDDAGNAVIAWQSNHQPGEANNIYARKFPIAGAPSASDELIAGGGAEQFNPSISVNRLGMFVIAWTDASGLSNAQIIYAQRFTADPVFQTDGGRLAPWPAPSGFSGNFAAVAMAPNDRSFDITWTAGDGTFQTAGIHLRRYGANDSDSGDLGVNNLTNNQQEGFSSICRRPDSSLLITFQRDATGAEPYDLYLVPYNAAGQHLGERTIVANSTDEEAATAVWLNDSKALLVWRDDAIDGDGAGVAMAFYNNGTISGRTKVNSYTAGIQTPGYSYGRFNGGATAAADGAGNYFIVWESQNQDGSGYGIYAKKVLVTNPPSITTLAATMVGKTTATLRAEINPNSSSGATVAFDYDEDPGFGSPEVVQVPGVFTELNPQQVQAQVTGLTEGVRYYFRARATVGTQVFPGNTLDFTTANLAPVANDDVFIILGSEQMAVLQNDFDADGDSLRIVSVGAPVGGSGDPQISTDGKKISYNPNDIFPDQPDGDSFTYTISDQSVDGSIATATVHVFSVKVLRGVYSGLIGDANSGVDTAGRLDITLSATGQVTGSFKWLGRLYTFKGGAPLGADGRLTITKPKIGPDGKPVSGEVLELTLTLDPMTRLLAGTLTDTETDIVVQAELTGTATADDVNTLPEPGTFNAYIDTGTSAGLAEAAPAEGAIPLLPRGIGFTQVTVARNGRTRPARFVGRMPDAQPFSSGAKALVKALHALTGARYVLSVDNLYPKTRDVNNHPQNGGFVSGNVGFTKVADRMDSALNWERRANVGTRFPAGFRTGPDAFIATLNAIRYNRPAPGVLPAGIVNDTRTINAKIEFTEGNLASTIVHALKLRRIGHGPVTTRVEPLNPSADGEEVKISIDAKTGKFVGSFIHPANSGLRKPVRTVISGLFQSQDGEGVFDAPDANSTTGRITILAQ